MMETIRFEYRVPEHVGTSAVAEAAAWERLGEQLALNLSHRLANDQYHLMRAKKDQAQDYRTKEIVWSITLEIGGEREQTMLAELHDRIEGINSFTLRRNNRQPKKTTQVHRPDKETLAKLEANAPRSGRRVLIATKPTICDAER